MVGVRWVGVLATVLTGSCDGGSGVTVLQPTPDDNAGAAASGNGASDGGRGTSEPAVTALTLDVVDYVRELASPAAGVWVRIDGSGTPVEVLTDERGHASALVSTATGPWDVTVARAGSIPISIIDVSGPIAQPVHLPPLVQQRPNETRWRLSGAVSGRIDPASQLGLSGSLLRSVSNLGSTYTASLAAPPEPGSVRLLALERSSSVDPSWGPISNATWLDVPWTGQDLSADIVFPSPARHSEPMSMTIHAPTSGAVSGIGLTAPPDVAFRDDASGRFQVGSSKLEADPAREGRYTWTIDALAGDMAPTTAYAGLRDARDEHSAYVQAVPEEGAVIDLPPVEQLEAVGSEIDSLTLSWSASAYSRTGASSSRGDGERGGWFIYSQGARGLQTHAWPRLPSALTLSEVGLAGAPLRIKVFALSTSDGVEPWNWGALRAERAVIRTYGAPLARAPDAGPPEPQ